MAGFKYKSFSFVGQSTDFPAGTTDVLIRQKEEFICKNVAQAIIDTNTGWGLDTDRNATITDFANVPTIGSTTKFAPGLFLVNSTSHNKLFICYCGTSNRNGVNLSTDQMTTVYYSVYINEDTELTGLCMSMISGDSNQSFGENFDSSFIPSSGTRLAADCLCKRSLSNSNFTIAYENTLGKTYTYDLFVTPYCVFFRVNGVIGYAVGRILGSLAHSTIDTSSQSKYGVIYFKRCGNEAETGTTLVLSLAPTSLYRTDTLSGTVTCLGNAPTSGQTYNYSSSIVLDVKDMHTIYGTSTTSYQSTVVCWAGASSVCKADGSWLGNTSERVVCYYPDNPALCRNTGIVNTSDSTIRWVPFICFIKTTDTTVHGIISGDGVKGFLDTDLFRYTGGAQGLLLDNGNFYNIHQYLTIGWDPSNETPNP